jgi:hypothetical protein
MEYFTLIDLEDGFFHIDIAKSDREKTALYWEEVNAVY